MGEDSKRDLERLYDEFRAGSPNAWDRFREKACSIVLAWLGLRDLELQRLLLSLRHLPTS
jgi:hypothetical protein